MDEQRDVEQELYSLLNQATNSFSKENIATTQEYISHSECPLAFETLCELLYLHRIKLSSHYFESLVSTGIVLGVHQKYWEPLRDLIT